MARVAVACGICVVVIVGACEDVPEVDLTGTEITVRLKDGDATLFAVRDGVDAEWQTRRAVAPGRYVFRVHGPYSVIASCFEATDVTEILTVQRSLDDPRELEMPCLLTNAPQAELPFRVSGTMVGPGRVELGSRSDASFEDNWTFDLLSKAGTFDLVAQSLEGNALIAIRRDVVISGPTVVPAIDLSVEGVPLAELPLTVSNLLPTDDPSAGFAVQTRSTSYGAMRSQLNAIQVVPSALLAASDTQQLVVEARDQQQAFGPTRAISREVVPGVSTVFALPAVLEPQIAVVERDLVASWTTLPELDTLELQGVFSNTVFVGLRVLITRGYLDATGVTSATLHSDVPGYLPAWKIDYAGEHSWQLETRTAGPNQIISQTSALVNSPKP